MQARTNWVKRLGAIIALLLLCVVAPTVRSNAATLPVGNGLRVSPVRSDITVQPGKSATVNVSITNVTGSTATFQAIINDFVANSDESGNPAIILDPTKYAPSHSLKRFVAPTATVTLLPGEQKTVPIVINVPGNAAGGGYYGAVRFAPADITGAKGKQISLSGSVGSLILVKVPGDIKEQLSIAGVDVFSGKHSSSFFTTNKNMTVTIRFQNEGNIQEAPFGKVLVKNRDNKIIDSHELNNITPPGNVLPDSIRRYSVPIKTGHFGEYKVVGNFGYGSNGQLLSVATTIYIVPIGLIIAFVIVVVLLAAAIFGIPRLIKAYNRRILKRAGRR